MIKRIVLGGIFFTLVLSFIVFGCIYAYHTGFTHPNLTRETAEMFSALSAYKFTNEEISWLTQGSVREDASPRYVNHFYDPINNQPWLGDNPGALTSKDWATNSQAQSLYPFGDQTFARAVYEYREGNKKEAFIALGHILHLIQDGSVPEHTRNDTHLPGSPETESPYEEWAERYNQEHTDQISENLLKQGKTMSFCFSLENCFNEIAGYSNGYFFSIDSIYDYEKPLIIRWGKELVNGINLTYAYGKDIDGSEFRLVSSGEIDWRNFNEPTKFRMDDNVLSDYWTRLSKKSVQVGAKVIKLFFDQIEYEEENNIPNKKPLSWFGGLINSIKSFLGLNIPKEKETVLAFSNEDNKTTEKNNEKHKSAVGEVVANEENNGGENADNSLTPMVSFNTPLVPLVSPNGSNTPPTPLESLDNSLESPNLPLDHSDDTADEPEVYISALPLPESGQEYIPPTPDGIGGADDGEESGNTLADMIEKYGDSFGGVWTEDSETETYESEATDDSESESETKTPSDTPDPLDTPLDPLDSLDNPIETEGEDDIESIDNLSEEEIPAPVPLISIIEVQTRGDGGAYDECVKIKNIDTKIISLLDIKLQSRGTSETSKWISRSGDGLPDIGINIGESIVLASKDYSGFGEAWRHIARWGLSDDGGGVRLVNSDGAVVAEKYWGNFEESDLSDENGEDDEDVDEEEEEGIKEQLDDEETDEEIVDEEDEIFGEEIGEDDEEDIDETKEESNEDFSETFDYDESYFVEGESGESASSTPSETEDPMIIFEGPPVLMGTLSNEIMILTADQSPYVVSVEFFVDSSSTLIIEPGVILKFGKEYMKTWMKFPTRLRVAGSLYVNGTEENPVIFTSIADDKFGGDTNLDSSATAPAWRDWGRLLIESNENNQIHISHAKFYYAGDDTGSFGNGAALVSRGGVIVNVDHCYFANNPTAISNFGWKNNESKQINVVNSLIENNGSGIILGVYAPIRVFHSTIRNNTNYGIYLEASSSNVFFAEHNNIYGNGKYGLWNFYGWELKGHALPLAEISAQNNWWGSADGPKPIGSGDKVGDKVDYSNWLTTEI